MVCIRTGRSDTPTGLFFSLPLRNLMGRGEAVTLSPQGILLPQGLKHT